MTSRERVLELCPGAFARNHGSSCQIYMPTKVDYLFQKIAERKLEDDAWAAALRVLEGEKKEDGNV